MVHIKKFLVSGMVFLLIGIFLYTILYLSVDRILNRKESDAIYIWGDSQTFEGLDIELLKERTGQKIYSAAQHGAGVYDFLVFSEKVPERVSVIIAFSKLALIRDKNRDYNSTGLSLKTIRLLSEHGYSFEEMYDIFQRNIIPVKMYSSMSKHHAASVTINESAKEGLLDVFSEKKGAMDDKAALYLLGLKRLVEKECEITLIEFPINSMIRSNEMNSGIKNDLDDFRRNVMDFCTIDLEQDITFDQNENYMYDLTHLNASGAAFITGEIIIDELDDQQNNFLSHQ